MNREQIGRYELHEVLGSGSFATVWRAHDPVVGMDVAIKVLGDNLARDRHMRERFVAEARIGLEANSSRMIRVHGVDETDDGVPYMVMALANRGSLQERLDEQGRFEVAEAVSVGREIALAVADLHRHRHIHRDIKPANVLFQTSPDGEEIEEVLLGDFGLARAVDKSAVTMISGTPGYAAPEQAEGLEQLTSQADLYPIGLTMLELLTGEPPVRRRSMRSAAEQGAIDVRAVLDQHEVKRPVALDELLHELVQRDPQARPASAQVVAARLGEIGQGLVSGDGESAAVAASAPRPVPSRRVLVAAAAAVAIVVGLVIGLVIWLGGDRGTDPSADPAAATADLTAAIPAPSDGSLSSVDDVPLPTNAVLDRANSEPGEVIVANVSGSVGEVVDFYESNAEWTVLNRVNNGDQATLLVSGDGPQFDVTLAPTALTSGSTTTNIVIRPAAPR